MEHQAQLPVDVKEHTQDWAKYNLAKTQEKRLFYELLHELCSLIPERPYSFGRPPIQLKDLVFMCGLKLYNNFSSRKIDFDLKQAKACGYIKEAPHYNRLSDFLNAEGTYELLSKLLTISALPLKNLEDAYSMDSSGFGSYQYERWMRAKFKNKRGWRNYVKGHICIGTRTNVIVAATVTFGNEADIKQAPKLLGTLQQFRPRKVSADKAYSSYEILRLIDSMNAQPFIDFRDNTNPSEDAPEIWKRMYSYLLRNRAEFRKNYNKRSNVETTFSMVKLRLGEFLRSKNHQAQKSELLMKFIVHNITCLVAEIYESDIHIDFRNAMNKVMGCGLSVTK